MDDSVLNNSDLIMLNEFIDSNLSDTIDYDLALEELLKLSIFIEENLFAINHSTIYDIVMDNRILNSILETITQNIQDYQDLDTISANVNDNEMAFLLLKAYLMQNNFIAEEMEDYIDHTESDYYHSNKESRLESIELSGKTVRKLRQMLLTDREKTTELIIRHYAKVIEKQLPPHGNYNDLYQEGCIAIIKAINGFLLSTKSLSIYVWAAVSNYFRRYINDANKDWENIDDLDENDYPYSLTSLGEEPFEETIIKELPFKIDDILQQPYFTDYNRIILLTYFCNDETNNKLYEFYDASKQSLYERLHRCFKYLLNNKTIIEAVPYLNDPDKAAQTIKDNINIVDLTLNYLYNDFARIIADVPLTELELSTLCYYYGLNNYRRKSLAEIAEIYGLTYQKAASIKNKAMYKIISQKLIPHMDLIPDLDKKIKEYGERYTSNRKRRKNK